MIKLLNIIVMKNISHQQFSSFRREIDKFFYKKQIIVFVSTKLS